MMCWTLRSSRTTSQCRWPGSGRTTKANATFSSASSTRWVRRPASTSTALGQLVFTSCENRGDPIDIGGSGIPISQVVSFSDHVVDVSNDARIPVSLHGWILPENLDASESVAHVYESPEDWDYPDPARPCGGPVV